MLEPTGYFYTNLMQTSPDFMFNRASIWPVSIITNSCTHSKIFIKNTLKAHVKFTPTCFGTQMEPSSGGEQLILAKVYIWFNGASPYSQCCGGIWPPVDGSMCVPKHVVVNFTWAFNVFLINIVLWVHELVIIETGIHHHSTLNTIKNYTHTHKLKTIIRILFKKNFI